MLRDGIRRVSKELELTHGVESKGLWTSAWQLSASVDATTYFGRWAAQETARQYIALAIVDVLPGWPARTGTRTAAPWTSAASPEGP